MAERLTGNVLLFEPMVTWFIHAHVRHRASIGETNQNATFMCIKIQPGSVFSSIFKHNDEKRLCVLSFRFSLKKIVIIIVLLNHYPIAVFENTECHM